MAVETSDYGIQGNRNSGSIGVYFGFCRDECLRCWADLDRLSGSRSDFGNGSRSDFGNDSRSASGSASDYASYNASDNASDNASYYASDNLVLGHQLQ